MFAAAGSFLVSAIAYSGSNALNSALSTFFWSGLIPLLGLAFMPWVVETKGKVLLD